MSDKMAQVNWDDDGFPGIGEDPKIRQLRTEPVQAQTVALEAIAEGMNILQLLACATDKTQWIDDSVPLSKLNELARSLGYRDAQSVHSQVEGDRQDEMNGRRDGTEWWSH